MRKILCAALAAAASMAVQSVELDASIMAIKRDSDFVWAKVPKDEDYFMAGEKRAKVGREAQPPQAAST